MAVRRDQVVLGAAAAAVLVGIVVFAAPGGVRETVVPDPTPMAGRPLTGGGLKAGVRYRTRTFIPELSFVVGDRDWTVGDVTRTDYLRLDHTKSSYVTFSHLTEAHDIPDRDPGRTLQDLYGWMKRHPDLIVGEAEPVTIAGVRGQSFPVTVHFSRAAQAAGACRPLLLVCTAISPDRYYPDGTRLRTIILPLPAGPFVIDVQGQTPRDLDEVEVPAAAVLRSLRVDLTTP